MTKFVCGIRHKESRVLYGLAIVDDLQHWHNEIKAMLKSNPESAFAMFPKDYELAYMEIKTDDKAFSSCALPSFDAERV